VELAQGCSSVADRVDREIDVPCAGEVARPLEMAFDRRREHGVPRPRARDEVFEAH
jgi:hypothetical protein